MQVYANLCKWVRVSHMNTTLSAEIGNWLRRFSFNVEVHFESAFDSGLHRRPILCKFMQISWFYPTSRRPLLPELLNNYVGSDHLDFATIITWCLFAVSYIVNQIHANLCKLADINHVKTTPSTGISEQPCRIWSLRLCYDYNSLFVWC